MSVINWNNHVFNSRLMIWFDFSGFQSSCWSIHNNLSCSKCGTKEVQTGVSLYVMLLYHIDLFDVFTLGLFYLHRNREGDWLCLCRPVPFSLWVPVSVWLVQHHRLRRSVSRPAQSVHHSAEGGPRPPRAEENCEWRSCQKLTGERKYSYIELKTKRTCLSFILIKMCFISRLYSRRSLSATTPQPHTAASPLTSADTPSRRSRHPTARRGSSLKGLSDNYTFSFSHAEM